MTLIVLDRKSRLIQHPSELPDFTSAKRLYLDVETKNVTHGIVSNKDDGRYPFKGDRICGFAFSVDEVAYYVPMRHTRQKHLQNLPLNVCRQWLRDHLTSVYEWCNHNIVFDAMFCHFDDVEFDCRLVDTLTLAKVHDSDKLGYGLKALCQEWLDLDQPDVDAVEAYLKGIGSRNYADVPIDVLGLYACHDVHRNRALMGFLEERKPDDMSRVWENEILLTPVLYDMELAGLRIDPIECKKESLKSIRLMIEHAEIIRDITDREFTNSSKCIYDILVVQCGLPIVATIKEKKDGRLIDTGRPTFDKDAMALYTIHPQVQADPKLQKLVNSILVFRTESQFKGLFPESFCQLHDDNNYIHPSYNQIVRTGRMSCRRPNAQQQNKRSKSLILPPHGMVFLSCDYSQIEYRLIVHYINDKDAIAAYNNDPTTDFHQWVADMIGISRPAGKTLNFGMAYGAGKRKVESSLMTNPIIMGEVGKVVAEMITSGKIEPSQSDQIFKELCSEKARAAYEAYHERLPGIKTTSKAAAQKAKTRGFVFNAYGRRRHLASNVVYKAFNNLIQGCAMDIIKDCMIAISPRYSAESRQWGLQMAANVHDELLFAVPGPASHNPGLWSYITKTLETPSVAFSVPISVGLGLSDTHWAEAAGDETRIEGDKKFGKII